MGNVGSFINVFPYQIKTLFYGSAAGRPSLYRGVEVGSVHTGRSQECSVCQCPCSLCAARH